MTGMVLEPAPRLAELERVIERGERTFIEVGIALAEIKDQELYRSLGYKTFKGYVAGRWSFGDSRARQMMLAAETAQSVTTVTVQPPLTEFQTRALAKAGEAAPEVWERVVADHGEAASASTIREYVVDAIDPPDPTEAWAQCPHCGGFGRIRMDT